MEQFTKWIDYNLLEEAESAPADSFALYQADCLDFPLPHRH